MNADSALSCCAGSALKQSCFNKAREWTLQAVDFDRVWLLEQHCGSGCTAACSAHSVWGVSPRWGWPQGCVSPSQWLYLATHRAEGQQSPALGWPCW